MQTLSQACWALWAKKSKPGQMGWLPLPQHMADTAHTARLLWNCWLSPSLRHCISRGWAEEEDAGQLLVFLASAHDLAKATPVFQSKARSFLSDDLDQQLLEGLRGSGLPCDEPQGFISLKHTHHAFAGQLLLESMGCPPEIASIIGAHHGRSTVADEIRKNLLSSYTKHYHMEKQGKVPWQRVQEELLELALSLSGFDILADLPIPRQEAQVLLCGLVIMADWIASNEYYFPYIQWGQTVTPDLAGARAEKAWDQLNLSRGWQWDAFSVRPDYYKDRFGIHNPYSAQRDVVNVAEGIVQPGLFILEAPMGAGKTEAALAAAEIFAEKTQCAGVFFALPTQATSNAMFERLLKWVRALEGTNRFSIQLAHGKAQFNETYLHLLEGSRGIGENEEDIVVHQWFEGNKKSLLADFVVGTIDQFLLSALKQKHVMLRHVGLAGKVVILDECHAYDTYMNRYLDQALAWMGAYGVPVIVLSATLPAKRRAELVYAYLGKSPVPPPQRRKPGQRQASPPPPPAWTLSRAYPLITWTEGEEVFQHQVQDAGASRHVTLDLLSRDALAPKLADLLQNGGYAGVMVNTVEKAQEIALELREFFGEEHVTLSHARFIAPDRAKIEAKLLQMLGRPKEGEVRSGTHIVVGTQVIEQSLDLDFDVLITELCPMDLLLQRMGRLHRHKRKRPEGLERPLCLVMGAGEGEPLDQGTKAVYHEYFLLRTKALLPKDGVTLPQDIPTLVQNVYDDKRPLPIKPEGYDDALTNWKYGTAVQKGKAGTFLLGKPGARSTLVDWMVNPPGDAMGEAAVRDSGDSLEVLVVYQLREGVYAPLPWVEWDENGQKLHCDIPAYVVPPANIARLLARQSIRLPRLLCHPGVIKQTIDALEQSNRPILPWQESPWLKGQLFLILSENLQADVCGISLAYQQGLGLMIVKSKGGGHEGKGV